MTSTPERVRLAELVATISLRTDLGLGQPMEHVLRHTLVSLRMAELLELDVAERNVAYYAGLLCWVGCHTDAYEQAKWFGDDIAAKRDSFRYDQGRATHAVAYFLRSVGAGHSPFTKARLWATLPLAARQNAMIDLRNHWLAADELTQRLGLGEDVRQSLRESFERWDGKGPGGASGEGVRLTSRLVILADVVTAFYASGGIEAAVTGGEATGGDTVRPRAWVHDIGRLGVSNSIWDKPGSLNRSETERVHLHP